MASRVEQNPPRVAGLRLGEDTVRRDDPDTGERVEAIKRQLLEHPDVAWAAVRGRKAPLVGNVVAADVVLRDGLAKGDPGAPDQAALQAWCAERLPEYAVPRRVKYLSEIPIKESLKSDV